MMRWIARWSAFLLIVTAVPAWAGADLKTIPTKPDPAMAYLLIDIRTDPVTSLAPVVTFARYDAERHDVRGLGRAVDAPVVEGEDLRVQKSVKRGPGRKDGNGVHLLSLTPGTWTIEGIGTEAQSLGSYSFELLPGQVTDIGIMTIRYTDHAGKPVAPLAAGRFMKMILMAHVGKVPTLVTVASVRARTPQDAVVMPAITALPSQPATMVPGATFGNHLGGLVARLDRAPTTD